MRILRVFESVSVDGFFTDASGDMSFAHAPPDPEYLAWVAQNAGSGGALLFGRKTYEQMAAFWPSEVAAQQMPEVARGMNAATKYVATRTIVPTWHNAHRLAGELVDAVRALKAEPGPPIVVLGSGSVASQLGEAGLVDEYQLVIVPIALGAGRSIFARRTPLRRVAERAFANGHVMVTYAT